MPRTIIAFDDDDDSDLYVDFFPFDATPGPSRAREPSPPDVIDIPDDTDVEFAESPDPLLQQELEGSQNEIANIDKKIDELYKNITELKQLRSIREHDMRSVQSQIEMRVRTGGRRIYHQFDYETRMDFEWSEEMANRMKSVFGIEKFRHCQRGVCNAVMDKRDVVCVMPTGGGKSLTYQLPALVQTGCTLVISPLLALIADQVFHLVEAGIEAVRYTGATPEHERQRIYNRLYAMADGTLSEGQKEIKLCYVTPEMILRSSKFKRMLSYLFENGQLTRIVLDEAHCVSELGHDFRKDYGQLGILRTCYPNVPILALSATCPPRVLNDVLHTLNMKSIIEHNDPRRTLYFSSPLYRKNLHYEILPKPEVQREAIGGIVKYILEKHPHDSGIIYCLRQKDSETVAKELQTMSMGKIRADVYHADLPDAHKENLHIEWRRGNIKVVCATIAFGLGIDKADVRFVLHFSVPKSIECYYQESGRAGRDGKDSDCILYYRPQDCMSLFAMVDSQRDGRDKVLAMIRFCENFVRCRKLLFSQYFSVATQLHKSSWTTDDLDASQPCGHCDNCKRLPENVETRDVTEDAWKLMKVLKAVQNQPMTLKRLTSLARGNSGGTYDIPGGGKGKIDIEEVIGSPIKLKPIDTEHLLNHLMTEKYVETSVVRSVHDRAIANVNVKLGAPAEEFLQYSRDNISRGIIRHTFLKRPRAPPVPRPQKQENGKEGVGRRRKRKRAVVEATSDEDNNIPNGQAKSDNETEEVEKQILDLTGYESELDNNVDKDDEIAYQWSRSIIYEPPPPPAKRRRPSRKSPRYDVPDSECEREKEEAIDISSD